MCNLPFPIFSTNRVTWNLPSNKMLQKLGAGNFRWCKQSQWTWPPHFQLILGSFLIDFWTPNHSCHLQMNTTSPYGLTSPYFRRCCFRCPNAGSIRSCEELEKGFHHMQPLKPSDTTTAVAKQAALSSWICSQLQAAGTAAWESRCPCPCQSSSPAHQTPERHHALWDKRACIFYKQRAIRNRMTPNTPWNKELLTKAISPIHANIFRQISTYTSANPSVRMKYAIHKNSHF